MAKKTKFGVIGANVKLRANMVFINFPRDRAELVAVCDRDASQLAEFHKTYPELSPKTYSDYRELLADPEVEAVFVMVRDQYHADITIAALEAGKAVYLEKPMAITLADCD